MVAVTWGRGTTILDTGTQAVIETIVLPPGGTIAEDERAAVGSPVSCAGWTPDGAHLLLVRGERLLAPVDTTTWEVDGAPIGVGAQSIEASHDDRRFAVASLRIPTIVILDAPTSTWNSGSPWPGTTWFSTSRSHPTAGCSPVAASRAPVRLRHHDLGTGVGTGPGARRLGAADGVAGRRPDDRDVRRRWHGRPLRRRAGARAGACRCRRPASPEPATPISCPGRTTNSSCSAATGPAAATPWSPRCGSSRRAPSSDGTSRQAEWDRYLPGRDLAAHVQRPALIARPDLRDGSGRDRRRSGNRVQAGCRHR